MKLPAFFSSFGALQWALALSVALHAALLTVRFVHPEAFQRIFQDTPLEVILVNARSDERPDMRWRGAAMPRRDWPAVRCLILP